MPHSFSYVHIMYIYRQTLITSSSLDCLVCLSVCTESGVIRRSTRWYSGSSSCRSRWRWWCWCSSWWQSMNRAVKRRTQSRSWSVWPGHHGLVNGIELRRNSCWRNPMACAYSRWRMWAPAPQSQLMWCVDCGGKLCWNFISREYHYNRVLFYISCYVL